MPAEEAVTTTILLLSGGGAAPTTTLPRTDFVIAADSGYALAEPLGVAVDLLIGDFDSIGAGDLAAAERDNLTIEPHPVDKDATDLELAMLAAADRGADRIVVAGGGAGRLDHLLGVALLLTDERWRDIGIEWHAGSSMAAVVRGERELRTAPGDLVSVVAISDCEISIRGCRWELDHQALPRGTTRGISNEATGGAVSVHVFSGVVLAITTRRGR